MFNVSVHIRRNNNKHYQNQANPRNNHYWHVICVKQWSWCVLEQDFFRFAYLNSPPIHRWHDNRRNFQFCLKKLKEKKWSLLKNACLLHNCFAFVMLYTRPMLMTHYDINFFFLHNHTKIILFNLISFYIIRNRPIL